MTSYRRTYKARSTNSSPTLINRISQIARVPHLIPTGGSASPSTSDKHQRRVACANSQLPTISTCVTICCTCIMQRLNCIPMRSTTRLLSRITPHINKTTTPSKCSIKTLRTPAHGAHPIIFISSVLNAATLIFARLAKETLKMTSVVISYKIIIRSKKFSWYSTSLIRDACNPKASSNTS